MKTVLARPRTWLVLVIVCAVVLAWRSHRHAKSTDDATVADGGDIDALLVDRLWIDHVPRGERDAFNIFLVMSQQSVGMFQKATAWQGAYEMFKYNARGKRQLDVTFPHTGDRNTVRATVTECHEQGMDYCLELSGSSRGVKKYYSRADWGAHSLADVELLETMLVHTEN